MMIQAFLAFNPAFEISLSCPMIRHFDESFIQELLSIYRPVAEEPNTFSSLLVKKL